ALAMNGYKIIVVRGVVPVGTNERIKQIISGLTENPFDIVMMPEFLEDIRTDSQEAAAIIMKLHSPVTNSIIATDLWSKKMIHEPQSTRP
ncbi:UDP-glucose 6-dehydrogenase, partial [Salmonella enterica subsp. enterica serovar Typhi]|nr:UDP-glucose 6-dehydrogenase [Salmonella enterica subsp. enterica serovar Typhi]